MNQALNLLIVCHGNSCRSIMAEALFKKLGRGLFNVQSAGNAPVTRLHPQVLGVLRRHGMGTDQLRSKSWNEFSTTRFDAVITVCERAAQDAYPLFPGRPEKIYWAIPNPLQFGNDDAETEAAIEESYLMLKNRVDHFCRNRRAQLSAPPMEQAAG
ncbi:MAG: arsenate reductase ArsC [Micavibrio sp.]